MHILSNEPRTCFFWNFKKPPREVQKKNSNYCPSLAMGHSEKKNAKKDKKADKVQEKAEEIVEVKVLPSLSCTIPSTMDLYAHFVCIQAKKHKKEKKDKNQKKDKKDKEHKKESKGEFEVWFDFVKEML